MSIPVGRASPPAAEGRSENEAGGDARPTETAAMLVAQAHSFASQSRLAVTLSWVAGYTNIVCLILCLHPTSHISGTASQLGQYLVELRTRGVEIVPVIVLLACFVFGAGLSGAVTELGRRRGWDSIYVLPIAIELLLLTIVGVTIQLTTLVGDEGARATAAGTGSQWVILAAASAAMGLQNATITRISSGVVRTTHVTGVATDLGSEAAHLVFVLWDRRSPDSRKKHPETPGAHNTSVRRVLLLLGIFASFTAGAALGTLMFDHARALMIYPPVVFLGWIIYVDSTQPIAEIEATRDAEDGDLPPGLAAYHVRRDARRKGKKHRMPNLLAWAERLPARTRVVVLDLDQVATLDDNAGLEIRHLLHHLRERGCKLVLAGVTPDQYAQLDRLGVLDLLDAMSIHADFDLALARGVSLLDEG